MDESLLLVIGSLLLLIVAIGAIRLFNVRRLARKRAALEASERLLGEAAIEAKRLSEQRRAAEKEIADSITIIDTHEPPRRESEFDYHVETPHHVAEAVADPGKTELVDTAPEAEREAAEDAARRDAERKAAEDTARRDAERKAAEDAARRDAERKAAEDTARRDAERKAAEDAARRDAERKAAEDAARRDAERKAAEDAARREAERKAAEDAARREAERKAAEDAARRDAERKATEDAARHEAARREAERERVEEARRANERQAAEDAARRAAERTVREQAARQDALPKTADETTRQETERQPVAGPERVVAERTTIEQLAARRRSAEDALRRDAERLEIDRRAIEQAVRSEEDERQAVEKAIAEEQRKRSISSAPQQPARKAKLPEETIVMIADDSRVVRVKTSRLLTANQYRVAAAEDGVDAARQIEASPPDVLVTDVDMPGLNGFQLAKMVRDNPRTAKLPIIMVTSDNEQLRAEAARIGVNVVLGKPYPEEQLIAHIQQLMDGQAGI